MLRFFITLTLFSFLLSFTSQATTLKEVEVKIEEISKLPSSVQNDQVLAEWKSVAAVISQSDSLKEQLASFKGFADLLQPLPTASTATLGDQDLNELNISLAQLNNSRDLLQERLKNLNDAILSGNAQLNTNPTQITKIDQQIGALTPTNLANNSPLSQALLKKSEAQQQQLLLKKDLLLKENEIYSQQIKELPLAISQTKSSLLELDTLIKQTRQKIATEQKEASVKATAEIENTFQSLKNIPALQDLLRKIDQLNSSRNSSGGSLSQISIAEKELAQIKKTQLVVQERKALAINRLKLLNDAQLPIDSQTGLLLRNQRALLPSPVSLQETLKQQIYDAAQAQLESLNIQQELTKTPLLKQEAIDTLLKQESSLSKDQITGLLGKHQALLTSLSSDYQKLNSLLTRSTAIHKETIQSIQSYSAFIDKRLLWIKSSSPLHLKEPALAGKDLLCILESVAQPSFVSSLLAQFKANLAFLLSLLISAAVLFIKRGQLIKKLEHCSQAAARRNCTSIIPTLLTFLVTLLLALPLPLLALFLYTIIPPQHLLSPGLFALSRALLPLTFLYAACRPHGLLSDHLRVPVEKATLIRKTLCWFIPVLIPLLTIIVSLSNSSFSPESGRLLYLFAMGVAALFIHRLLHPKRSLLCPAEGPTARTALYYYAALLLPLFLAVLSALGYFYSALTLRTQIIASIGVVIIAFLIIRTLSRWILVSKRRLFINQALRRREAALAEQNAANKNGESSDLPSLDEVKAEAVDVVQVEEQTLSLVRLGTSAAAFFAIWAIWSSSLPALSAIDSIKLWGEKSAPVTQNDSNSDPTQALTSPLQQFLPEESDASSASEGSPVNEELPDLIRPNDGAVSLQDLILSIVFIALTIFAARNIPGLLSLTLFNKINLGQGGNFALTTTARYVIVVVGIIIALGKIGITWSKVQWIAAAITLGIGFGLQEVFANFVAGIILLYERPIRIGDIVTIGDITGRVTQIKIRATTLRQLNNRDLVVPNKEFITGQIVNWSLDDTTLRVEALVGVAYGTDLELVRETLLKVANDHPKLLKTPSPDLIFTDFGDSSLNFALRGFVAHPDDFIRTKSELLFGINEALAKAGVEIPFPQRDLHLRSSDVSFSANPQKDANQ